MNAFNAWLRRWAIARANNKICTWLYENRDGFAIRFDKDCHDVAGNDLPWRVKPIFELVLFVSLAIKWRSRARCIDKLNEFALAEITEFDWHELARFDPASGAPLSALADFCSMSRMDWSFDLSYLDMLNATGFFDGLDRLPYREMEILHSRSLKDSVDLSGEIADIFSTTSFGRGQLICRYSVDDAYSLTHAIFYLTDFGDSSVSRHLSAEIVQRMRAHLVALMVIMMRVDNTDILGELLICWHFCDFHKSVTKRAELTVVRTATDYFLAQLRPEGCIMPQRKIQVDNIAPSAMFATAYHTTLVGAILLNLILRR